MTESCSARAAPCSRQAAVKAALTAQARNHRTRLPGPAALPDSEGDSAVDVAEERGCANTGGLLKLRIKDKDLGKYFPMEFKGSQDKLAGQGGLTPRCIRELAELFRRRPPDDRAVAGLLARRVSLGKSAQGTVRLCGDSPPHVDYAVQPVGGVLAHQLHRESSRTRAGGAGRVREVAHRHRWLQTAKRIANTRRNRSQGDCCEMSVIPPSPPTVRKALGCWKRSCPGSPVRLPSWSTYQCF